jgi:hypothetical protein
MGVDIQVRLNIDRIKINVVVGKTMFIQIKDQLWTLQKHYKQTFLGGVMKIVKQDEFLMRCNFYIKNGNKVNRMIAQIIAESSILFGKGTVQRYVSLTLFPSNLRGQDFGKFKSLLNQHVPHMNYAKLYEFGKVTYIEFAIDLLSHKAHSFIPYCQYCKTSKVWVEADGTLGTTYLGQRESKFRFRIYDKLKQRAKIGINQVANSLPCTRVEVSIRQTKLCVSELLELKNPFLKFRIADIAKAKAASTSVIWQQLICRCLTEGMPMAFKAVPKERKKFKALLDGCQVTWWDPATQWGYLPFALAKLAP